MPIHTSTTADEAIDALMDRASEHATARAEEMHLEDLRAVRKITAIGRIMQGEPNPLTGKPHSASSAETFVETDEQYAALRKQQRDATMTTIMTRARYDAAKFRAQLLCTLAEVQS